MSDIPIIRIDTANMPPERFVEVTYTPLDDDEAEEMLRWDRFVRWAERALVVLGAVFLLFTLAASAGYWWARYGERQWIEASRPVVETPCGSCRQGGVSPNTK